VRGAAVWALSQLLEREEFAEHAAKAIGAEADDSVREEWQLASNSARPHPESLTQNSCSIFRPWRDDGSGA
jgi:epoxyqueuosine reductase